MHRVLAQVLATLAGAIVVAAPGGGFAQPAPDPDQVQLGRLHYSGGGDWYGDPSSLPNLLSEFERRTGIDCAEHDTAIKATDPGLERLPFVYMTGHGNVMLTADEEAALRGWLERGGFLWCDDNYGLDSSFRRMVKRLFPEEELRLVAADHPIYHSFYDLTGVPKIHKHDGKPPQGWGLFRDGRLVIFYTYESDIGDGIEDADVHKDPPDKREAAMKMAINVFYYALTRARTAS
ncbi:MAG: DUF4159 domain-containing protein [Candidatus Krumholzibacteriia bacterium]|nr:DUF4159 domain-containing protein [bacterium]MCB9513618.1 DUF4159 domain-containing protein [Candidatus Latescibacterota bacterium]MCB9515538.1 DUF4159 domain-containing protein [Candidatus Latescibacterota bacterium]